MEPHSRCATKPFPVGQHDFEVGATSPLIRTRFPGVSLACLLAVLGSIILATTAPAWGRLYKCEDESGNVTYSDKACTPTQQEKTLSAGGVSARSGPGREVCGRVREVASTMARAMLGGIASQDAVNALGGLGSVRPEIMEVLSYVYSFKGVPRVTEPQITALAYNKCMAGGFSVEGPSDSSRRGTTRVASSQGSGFIVNKRGHVLTNHHVVDGCQSIRLQLDETYFTGQVVHARSEVDLALVQSEDLPDSCATFSDQAEPKRGGRVVAAGYPLQSMLARQINITDGIVSATAGPGEDRTVMQMTVPLQPGNSGGPVLDAYGLVSGVSVSKLSHLATLQRAGTLPENVNFAVKSAIARDFLLDHGIPFYTGSAAQELSNEEIGDDAEGYTVFIECQK